MRSAGGHRGAFGLAVLVGLLACARSGGELAYLRALNAARDQRFDLARVYLAEYLAAHPGDPAALRRCGRAWMSGTLQSPSQAVSCWEALLRTRPEDPEAHQELADAFLLLGRTDEALQHLDRIPASPTRDELRAEVLLQADPTAALEFARRSLDLADRPGLALVAAQAAELLGREEETLHFARLAVRAEPLSRTAHYLLSRALARSGERDAAAAEAEVHRLLLALASPPGPARGTPLERLRLLAGLEARIDPSSDAMRRVRMNLLIEAGLGDEGRELLDRALADDDGFGVRPLEIAGWAEKLGRGEVARRLLEEALETAEDADQRGGIADRLARLYRPARPERAEAVLRSALEQQPVAAGHHCLLAQVLVERGAESEAIEAYRRALDLAPWRADCRLALARVWQARGDRRRVRALLDAAPEPDPALARYRRQFGYEPR